MITYPYTPARGSVSSGAVRIFTAMAMLILCITWTPSAHAASGYKGRITVSDPAFVRDGDSLRVTLSVELQNVKMAPSSSTLFTPSLKAGSVSTDLPSVLVLGKNSEKAYQRMTRLHRPFAGGNIAEMVVAKKPVRRVIHYRAAVAYEPWMGSADLSVIEKRSDHNGPLRVASTVPLGTAMLASAAAQPEQIIQSQLQSQMQPQSQQPQSQSQMQTQSRVLQQQQYVSPTASSPVSPVVETPSYATVSSLPAQYRSAFQVSYVVPGADPGSTRRESGKAYIDFPTGITKIDPDYRSNRYELERISDQIRALKNNPQVTITGIYIDGYASPEGSHERNQSLSLERAQALRSHLISIYGFSPSIIVARGQGEDWATLENLIATSDLYSREGMLSILRMYNDSESRLRELRAFRDGIPYKEIAFRYFSQLRRLDYEIVYTMSSASERNSYENNYGSSNYGNTGGAYRASGIPEASGRPTNLSPAEIYRVAQGFDPSSFAFNEAMATAAKLYPENDEANINAAASALNRGDVASALVYLNKVTKKSAEYYNNMGVLSCQENDPRRAAEYFVLATALGSPEGAKNLEELNNIRN